MVPDDLMRGAERVSVLTDSSSLRFFIAQPTVVVFVDDRSQTSGDIHGVYSMVQAVTQIVLI